MRPRQRATAAMDGLSRILTQFIDQEGNPIGNAVDIPLDVTVNKLQLVCNALQGSEETIPYTFLIAEHEIKSNLNDALKSAFKTPNTEKLLEITCLPQAVYRVRAVTRCSSSIPGHSEPVISVAFNSNGQAVASGSGDKTVRFWDINTETPHHCCQGHQDWVLCVAWSPDSLHLASADKSGVVCVWDPKTGKQKGKQLTGHRSWVTCLSWEPYHSNVECRRFCSSSKDATIRIWDAFTGNCQLILSGHTKAVSCVKWGGVGLIYSASQDTTIKVWRASDGVLCRTLTGHGHWVNTLALSTDYSMKIAYFDPSKPNENLNALNSDELKLRAAKKYQAARGDCEKIVSGSDDFTLFLWQPESDKKSIARMTGHQQLINDVKFSPDGRLICSASFDKSIKVWNGKSGAFIATLRGHVQAVYQISFSSDSRLLVSGSADSTLKVWDLTSNKLLIDLPGHEDQVFALEWSPDGERVVSGGKDKVLKIWKR